MCQRHTPVQCSFSWKPTKWHWAVDWIQIPHPARSRRERWLAVANRRPLECIVSARAFWSRSDWSDDSTSLCLLEQFLRLYNFLFLCQIPNGPEAKLPGRLVLWVLVTHKWQQSHESRSLGCTREVSLAFSSKASPTPIVHAWMRVHVLLQTIDVFVVNMIDRLGFLFFH